MTGLSAWFHKPSCLLPSWATIWVGTGRSSPKVFYETIGITMWQRQYIKRLLLWRCQPQIQGPIDIASSRDGGVVVELGMLIFQPKTWTYALTSAVQGSPSPRMTALWISRWCPGAWDKNLWRPLVWQAAAKPCKLKCTLWLCNLVKEGSLTVLSGNPSISSLKGVWVCSHVPHQAECEMCWKEMAWRKL